MGNAVAEDSIFTKSPLILAVVPELHVEELSIKWIIKLALGNGKRTNAF